MSGVWNYGLTPEQIEKCNIVLAESRKYAHYARGQSYEGCPNNAMEGWSLYRIPSTLNPPTVVKLRYRDGQGKVLREIDCS